MAEYINRELLLSELLEELEYESPMYSTEQDKCFNKGLKCAIKDVKSQPTADVVEVKHGKWTTNSDRPDKIICSKCNVGFDMWKHEQKYFNYCPNCGAKMDLIFSE